MKFRKEELEDIHVCDFCYQQHQSYMRNIPFDIHRKKRVSNCTCCGSVMCDDCAVGSTNEIKGSILQQYGFVICRCCIVNYWRTTDMQDVIESHVLQQLEEVKKSMKSHLYMITNKKGELSIH